MAPERKDPTFKDIIQAIKRIVDQGGAGQPRIGQYSTDQDEQRRTQEQSPVPKPRRGLSPGLLLMAVVALAITIAAAVKNMK